MPRIAAASIEKHVRQQNARITAAARALFAQRGYAGTDMGDIAAAVGLARNSLYRYYANKDHILVACIREDMAEFMAELEALPTSQTEAKDGLRRWVEMQFEFATGPRHATLNLIREIRHTSGELNAEIRRLHDAPRSVLIALLQRMQLSSDVETLAALLQGMVLAGSVHALEVGPAERAAVHAALHAAVANVVEF